MDRTAVIDLGTNTFHILIAQLDNQDGFTEVFRSREFVQLAEEGIEIIGQNACDRAVETVTRFKEKIIEYGVKDFRTVGTAALREATNGSELASRLQQILERSIDIISGEREAHLIYQGTKLAIPFTKSKDLIMDIGGGSVEFIICDEMGNHWQESFKIGVAVLYKKFHNTDPIIPPEIQAIERHLEFCLTPLIDQARNHKIRNLIGASGSFEVLESMLDLKGNRGRYSEVSPSEFITLSEKIIESTFDERLHMEGLPETRTKLIVVAMILMQFVCKKINPEKILVSPYALKEGIISELYF